MGSLRVIGVGILYGVNLGYLARAMRNFGFEELYLVDVDQNTIKNSFKYCAHAREIIEKARIVSGLNEALLNVELAVGTTAISAKSKDNLLRICISPSKLKELYNRCKGLTALVFGRESTGLSNDELNLCDVIVNIPADPEYPTLNLSHAVAILLYELYQSRGSGSKNLNTVNKEELVQLFKIFSDLCEVTGIPPHKRRIAERALRNIVYRASPSRREASALLTPLRRAVTKISDSK